jgi:cell division protein FtsX
MTTRKKSGELEAQDRNSLPDSAYAFPKQRKEPLNDASHVRNAIARFNQVEDVTDEERREAFNRINRAAKRFDVEMTANSWKELAS